MISVIIPVYNEEENIELLYTRLKNKLIVSKLDHEILFVDDHSTDNSYLLLSSIAKKDKTVKVIRLSKNQGSHIALRAGLQYCKGNYVCSLSCDLQDPVELIIEMYNKIQEGYDIVWAYRKRRKDSTYRILLSKGYKFFIRQFTRLKTFNQVCDIFCISRQVVDSINKMQTKNISLFLAILDLGFKQSYIPYVREERRRGTSKFTMHKQLKLFADSFFPFSYFPIRCLTIFGFFSAFLSVVYAFFILYNRFWKGNIITGWSSLMVAILFFSSVQLAMLGIIGEYLWRTYDKTSQNLFYIEKSVGLKEKEHE